MPSYLEKFNSTIRKRQTEQILRLLNKQKSTGQIRTVEEFTSKLDNLIRELTQTNIVPTLKVLKPKEITSSDTHNFMLDRVEDDLNTAFEEAYNIDQVQRSHEAIVRDVLLKNLRHSLDELDAKISLYEFLNEDGNNFTHSIFSTFRELKEERVTRSSSLNKADLSRLFTDPRTGELLTPVTEDAVIDTTGERLVLSIRQGNDVDLRNVRQIFDSDTFTSAKVVNPPGMELKNLLSSEPNKYWTQTILVSDKTVKKVTTKLEFQLSGTRTINFVELKPATQLGMVLEKIYYLDSSNTVQLLQEPRITVDTKVVHFFPAISTNKIILEFSSS